MAGPLKQVRFATRNIFHSPPASPTIVSGFRGGPGAGGDSYASSSGLTPLSLGSAGAYSMMPSTPIKSSSLKSSSASASRPTSSRTPSSVASAPPVTPTHMHHTMLAGATPMRVSFQPMSMPAPLIPMTMTTTMARPPPPPQSGGGPVVVPPTPTYMPLPAPMQMPAFSPARSQSRHPAASHPHPYPQPHALHPLLDHHSNARSLKWDLRDSPSGAISGLAFGFGSEPATHPPVAKMVLRCVYLPGCIDILPGASASRTLSSSSHSSTRALTADGGAKSYVTLLDVLYTLHTSLRTNIREDEYASLRSDDRRRAYEAYTARWHRVQSHSSKRSSNQSSEGSGGEKERKAGMKRVDLLLEHAAFKGLVPVPVEEGGSGSDWFLCVR